MWTALVWLDKTAFKMNYLITQVRLLNGIWLSYVNSNIFITEFYRHLKPTYNMDVIVLDLDLGIRPCQIPYAWFGSGSEFLWDLKIGFIPTLFWAGDRRCSDNWKPICNPSLGTGVLTQQLNWLDKVSADRPGPFATTISSLPYPFQAGPYLDKKVHISMNILELFCPFMSCCLAGFGLNLGAKS